MKFKQALDRFRDKLFQGIHQHNLIYNTCWEDPHVDRMLLEMNAKSKVVMITGAGCNALDYLLDNPASIECVDVNPRQNALLELKRAIIKGNRHETLFEYFGRGTSVKALATYEKYIRGRLGEDAAKFWDKHILYFTGNARNKKTFYYRGTAGQFAWLFLKYVQARPKTHALLQQLLGAKSVEEQRLAYLELEPRLLTKLTKWVMNRHLTMSFLGVPRSQKSLITSNQQGGLAEYIRESLHRIFTQIPISENYFWFVYLKGYYTETCCPEYLKKENFESLHERNSRIRQHTCTISEFLQSNPGKYSHFILLDHQDWLAATQPELLREE